MNNEKIMPISMNSSVNKCPECKGSGMIVVEMSTEESREVYGDDRLIGYAVPCPSCNGGHIGRVQAVKQSANIPNAFYDSTMKDFDWNIYKNDDGSSISLAKQKEIIDSFIEKFNVWEKRGIGLYIYSGMKGSGKTFLASCICNELISRYPMRTRFVSASSLIDIAKSATKDGDKYERDPLKLLCDCKLLVLDDLGQKQTGGEYLGDILFRIMDERMQKKLITIVTSNIFIGQLQIDDRVTDRINKLCTPIPLPDYCVRAKQSKDEQISLFKELGIIKGKAV